MFAKIVVNVATLISPRLHYFIKAMKVKVTSLVVMVVVAITLISVAPVAFGTHLVTTPTFGSHEISDFSAEGGELCIAVKNPVLTIETTNKESASFAGQELIVNGDFSTGDATGWTFGCATEPWYGSEPTYEIVDQTARIYRTGAGSTGRGAWLYQEPNAYVGDASKLILSFRVKVDYQSLARPGDSNSEFAADVIVRYIDVNGNPGVFTRGFSYVGPSTYPNAETIPQSTWVSRSYDLASLSPKPATITRVLPDANGWDYDVSFDDVSLVYIARDAMDTTLPTSAVDPIEPYWQNADMVPFTITATALDDLSGVASVELFYRYSSDNVTFSPWTSFGVDTAAPWEWSFTAPVGHGFYEFYSIARDVAGNVEEPPDVADAACGVAVSVVVPATIDIDPDTLNLKSEGRWITAYIELPTGIESPTPLVLLEDDFNDGNDEGWTVFQGNWQVINGEYVYGANGITYVDGVTVAGDVSWENYTFESRFKLIEGDPEIYVLFRFTDYVTYERYNGYSFQYWPDRWSLLRWEIEKGWPWCSIISREPNPSSITSGEWYDVRVELSGDRIKCYVNDELKIDVHDSMFPNGRIGLRADVSKVAFDDIRVYTLAPLSAVRYDVADIDIDTILLESTVPAEPWPTEIGDHDGDGIPDLMIKFDCSALQDLVSVGDVELTVTGKVGEVPFEGSDVIRVIDPGEGRPEVPHEIDDSRGDDTPSGNTSGADGSVDSTDDMSDTSGKGGTDRTEPGNSAWGHSHNRSK